jgi:alpha-D-ribose 1-methylphosphonate 5-triphosphate synthase subunit PhnH
MKTCLMSRSPTEPPGALALAQIGHGFESPVHGAQQVFRATLDAISRPGTLQRLPVAALAGLQPPGVSVALGALLLMLLDAEVSLHLGAGLATEPLSAYLRFYTGVRVLADPTNADFIATPAAQAQPALWTALRTGSDEMPQDSATLLIDVPALAKTRLAPDDRLLQLRGPGIRSSEQLAVGGLSAEFWRARIACEASFPQGVDLILCCGEQIAALPRTTHLQLDQRDI